MMRNRGNQPQQLGSTNSEQEPDPVSGVNPSTDSQQQSTRNISKRTKEADDSFELEHRLVSGHNQYFNSNDSRFDPDGNIPRTAANNPSSNSSRPTFPPFRLNIVGEKLPSELSIIKSINKHCHLGLSFGRYAPAGKKNSFLLYANSSEQFERLMNRRIWPVQVCELDYSIDFPSKVPSSHSLVAVGIPAQWNLVELEEDLKQHYTSIVKVERLFVRGGIPISKVRIDFSSNQEVNKILKNKRLTIDDENTSFVVQPYTPPIKVLRCFNCQKYNDHVAAQCPFKDKPICFRCGQNHPFDPRCTNKICCANCNQEHMAGNPNCPAKIEERKKYQNNIPSSTSIQSKHQRTAPPAPWSTTSSKHNPHADPFVVLEKSTHFIDVDQNIFLNITNKIDLLSNKLEHIAAEQAKLIFSVNNVNQRINLFNKETQTIKDIIINQICPFVDQLAEVVLGKNKAADKDKLRSKLVHFNESIKSAIKSTDGDQLLFLPLPDPSPNESASEDV